MDIKFYDNESTSKESIEVLDNLVDSQFSRFVKNMPNGVFWNDDSKKVDKADAIALLACNMVVYLYKDKPVMPTVIEIQETLSADHGNCNVAQSHLYSCSTFEPLYNVDGEIGWSQSVQRYNRNCLFSYNKPTLGILAIHVF